MSFNRAERIIINSKEQNVSSGDVKGTLSHSPSARNMNDGEQVFARESNKPLALYIKFKGTLSKVYLSHDGNQVIDKNLSVGNDIVITGGINFNNDVTIGKKITGSNQTLSITTEEAVGSSVTPDGSLKVYINGTLYQIPVKEA